MILDVFDLRPCPPTPLPFIALGLHRVPSSKPFFFVCMGTVQSVNFFGFQNILRTPLPRAICDLQLRCTKAVKSHLLALENHEANDIILRRVLEFLSFFDIYDRIQICGYTSFILFFRMPRVYLGRLPYRATTRDIEKFV